MSRINTICFHIIDKIKDCFYNFGRRDLSLIEENGLLILLREKQLIDDFNNGDLLCHICGEKLSLDNISGFIVTGESYKFICNSPSCFNKGTKV